MKQIRGWLVNPKPLLDYAGDNLLWMSRETWNRVDVVERASFEVGCMQAQSVENNVS